MFDSQLSGEMFSVELRRGARGFGFSIRGGVEFGDMPLFVLRIADGGAASSDGRLRVSRHNFHSSCSHLPIIAGRRRTGGDKRSFDEGNDSCRCH